MGYPYGAAASRFQRDGMSLDSLGASRTSLHHGTDLFRTIRMLDVTPVYTGRINR